MTFSLDRIDENDPDRMNVRVTSDDRQFAAGIVVRDLRPNPNGGRRLKRWVVIRGLPILDFEHGYPTAQAAARALVDHLADGATPTAKMNP